MCGENKHVEKVREINNGRLNIAAEPHQVFVKQIPSSY